MRLYSLLIAEDEDNTREGLTNYIDWPELGFQVVASVRDGKEAIQFIEQRTESVDVILSDIRMDKVSGLGQFTRNYTQTTKRGLLTTNKG